MTQVVFPEYSNEPTGIPVEIPGQSDPLTLFRKLISNVVVSNFHISKKDQFGGMLYNRPNTTVANLATQMGSSSSGSGNRSLALGAFSIAREDGAVALGVYAQAGPDAIAIGDQARALAARSMAFGSHAFAEHTNSIVFGYGARSTATNQATFGTSIQMTSTEPRWIFNETDQAANEKLWDFDLNAKTLKLRTRTDADGAGVDILSILRGTGTTLTSITLAGLTEIQDGVNPQTFRAYNTFSSATDYERGTFGWTSNTLRVGTEKGSGGGTARALRLITDGTERWDIQATTGHLFPSSDATYDIGTSGARVRGIYSVIAGLTEGAAPSAPAANEVLIYAQDNGAGKTQLMALFATGAAQQIAIQP